jgi:hypothetical protein
MCHYLLFGRVIFIAFSLSIFSEFSVRILCFNNKEKVTVLNLLK